MPSLHELNLSHNGLTTIPDSILQLPKLFLLDISNNNISDLKELEKLKAIPVFLFLCVFLLGSRHFINWSVITIHWWMIVWLYVILVLCYRIDSNSPWADSSADSYQPCRHGRVQSEENSEKENDGGAKRKVGSMLWDRCLVVCRRSERQRDWRYWLLLFVYC